MEIVGLIISLFILYLVIKAAVDHSETAQNIREIKHYLLNDGDNQKSESTLEVDPEGYES